ncbi:MAG: hypothetical protein K2Q22_02125 [Cytophagales bacterium]|nr:hypothetical protein [Cytophagales bacterium]
MTNTVNINKLLAYGSVQTFFNLTNDNQWQHRPGINLKYRLGVEFVMSRKNSLLAEYEYFQTSTKYQTDPRVVIYSGTDQNLFQVRTSAMTLGLTYTFFNTEKGSLSPYGFYQQVGLKYLYCAVENSYGEVTQYWPTIGKTFVFENYSAALVTYGFGRRWIFFDRMLFNAGFDFGYIVGANPLGMVSPENGTKSYLSDDVNYGRTINRLSALYFVNFNVGLGFLLF